MADCSISIIIPAYNVEKYLLAALESIKTQTELPDEVILIDDGSTDGTYSVAKGCELPVRYQVVSIANKGQGNARNFGVSMASSDYVYFFDSDDLLTPNFVSSIKEQIQNNQCPDIVLFSGESFNDSEYRGKRWVDYRRGFSGAFMERVEFLDVAYINNALFCSPCLYITKRSLWGGEKLEFGTNYLEDEAIFYPLLFACKSFLVVDEIFFQRRNRDNSTMTMDPNAKHVKGALNCIEAILDLYKAKQITRRECWHISKRLQTRCIVYIVLARQARIDIDLNIVLKVIRSTKSIHLTLRAIYFGIQADQYLMVRKARQFFKSFI